MPGVTLPPLGLPGTNVVPDSRPSSRSSTSSTVFTSVPHVVYDYCAFQRPAKQGYSLRRPMPSRLPSIRNTKGGSVQKRHGSMNDVRSRYSAKYRRGSDLGSRLTASSPFLQKSAPEDCLKCMLKVPHRKCEAHKYIRVGGGYRHSYWFVKCLLEELELQRQQELIRRERLDAIREKKVRAIRTYIRTKSGRLVERIIYLDEEDYEAFKSGKNQKDILAKYLSKDEAKQLDSWDKDEVKAIKTYVRTKSGRLIEKLVYVSKDEYNAMKEGKVDAKDLLKKYIKPEDGETIEGWGEQEMKTIKTYVRTKSGRLIEKTIMVSKEDYDAMMKDGKDPAEILKKYMAVGDGEKIESWQSAEPMKSIKMKIRTKSGRIIEKTIMVSKEDYEALTKGGASADAILGKYMDSGDNIESWEKADTKPMKVIKTYVRTKSGRLIEKTVLLTEDEYKAFQEQGGDPEFLKKFIKLEKGEAIEDWEKASTVYEASDDEDEVFKKAKAGTKLIGKDGTVYEVVVDPLTGKKYKKKIGHESDPAMASVVKSIKAKAKKKGGRGGGNSDEETVVERSRRKQGKRNADSDSEYSYRSVVSAGGTKHVRRRRKKADGTYSDSESYHSDKDEEGAARRRRRRRERKHGSDSAHSYYSVVSAGGTRKVKRRRKRGDGTYSASESYHSSDSELEGGGLHKGKKKKKRREHGSDSEYSYFSEVSEGGTKRRQRKKRIRDEHGRVIGHGKAEAYSSPDDSDSESVYTLKSDGKGGKIRVKKEKPNKGKGKKGKGKGDINGDSSPDVFSDATTDSDAVDLENMTEEERARYLSAREKRRAEREKKRREKYGDAYDEMVAKHEKKKQEKKEKAKRLKEEEERKKASKSMVNYDKMQGRDKGPAGKTDGRDLGPGHDEWGKKKKGKDGHEADDESDEDGIPGKRKKKKGRKGSSASTEYDIEYDDKGNIIKKVRRKKPGDDESEYEDEYDAEGNVIGRKKKPKRPGSGGSDSSKGDYFETTADGKVRLKQGKKKIDLNKLTSDDLRKLGIDPNLSKQEIARLLKEKFGDDIVITKGKTKVGTKRLSEYGSDVDTDELADDSDLDISTLKGHRRVKIKMKRGGQALLDHMKKILDQSNLHDDDYAKDLDEKGDIDFLAHYRLVDSKKLEGYARAFVVEDEDFDTVIDSNETRIALDGVPSIHAMTEKQLDYVLKVLKIDDASQVTFRMFAVISALCERVTQMDPISKHLLEICNLLDIERKMDLYRLMFYHNTSSDRDGNFITAESLKIELIAGGLNWKQQQHVMERLQPNVFGEISFLDYLCYIPLFMSMHDNICVDPLDMRDDKYTGNLRKTSGATRQRDMNPLGYPLKKDSSHMLRQQAQDLVEGRIDPNELKKEKLELLKKYAALPKIIETAPKIKVSDKLDWKAGKVLVRQVCTAYRQAKEGDRFEKDGVVYEYSKDPVTGKLIKKVVGAKKAFRKGGRGTPEGLSEKELKDYKRGKRNNDSDSEYSYTSHVSAGGTRHVQRRRKREDGTYSAPESYHSSQDEEGEARRRQRRRDRRHANSAHSYYSVVSEGGTRHTKRRRRREDGTYSASEIYESPDENDVGNSRRNFLAADGEFNFGPSTKRNAESADEDSEYSYYSERSEGGTRYEFKRKVFRDIRGNKVGYGAALPHNDAETDGASLRPRIGSFTGETLDAEEYANRRLKPIARADSMVKQFLTDVNTLPQERPEDAQWPGASEPGDQTEGPKQADDLSDLSTKTEEELQRERERQEKRKQMQKNIDLANERRRKREQEKLERLERQRQKEEEEAARRREMELSERRKSVISERSGRAGTPREKPKSMVTYERGPGREATNPSMKTDNRDIGLSHDNWGANGRRKSYVGKQHGEKQDDPSRVKSRREIRDFPTFNKLPSINPLKGTSKDRRGSNISNIGGKVKIKETDEEDKSKTQEKQDGNQQKKKAEDMFEYDKDGNIRLKDGVKAIDLDNLTADDLRRMGIDPNLSKAEIARKLKEKFGEDLMIQDGGKAVGTRRIEDYDKYKSIIELANDPNFDVSSVRGPKRMNILFTRGGQILVEHMKRVLVESNLRRQDYAQDLDERDSSIDFLNHYRLVDPGKLEGYAKAFVVEDGNLDTVINYTELRLALEGIVSIEEMTKKQMDYVLKVLHIDDSTQLTFRMFAVISALCERVTTMDPVARHLLDICNLADIERKLDLYNAMFYHNVQSDRDPNHITSESLKIELMAGGLNWGQQQFIMRQMEPNPWGEISFLDYICYIPLFMSMHDNICDNPLDMSDRKYTMPPRKRPPSTQRDMNPLGNPLSKNSTYLLRKQALDLMAGKLDKSGLQAEKIELLNRYATRCPVVMPYSRQSTNTSDHFDQHSDLIF